jgi:hypothetical protein
MTRRLLLAILLFAASLRADAGFFTDIWWKKSEPGWGVNLVQTDNYIFATFYIYGEDGTPTWVVAGLQWNGVDRYTGDMTATHGTFFGLPWDPTASAEATVGTASFIPNPANAYEGTLTYTVANTLPAGASTMPAGKKALAIGTSTSQIERFSLGASALSGSFRGRQVGAYSACTNGVDNHEYTDSFRLTVNQLPDHTATFVFDFENGVSCTFAGTLIQNGLLYRGPVTYVCTGSFTLNTNATLAEVRQTLHGLEGTFVAANAGAGCTESARFSATTR